MDADSAVSQYLERHAEPEAELASRVTRRFGHVLTIPATGERDELRALLERIPTGSLGEVLVICMVNARVGSPQPMHDANAAVVSDLRSEFGPAEWRDPDFGSQWHERPHGALWLFDRATAGRELPDRQGVGLARKIAADVALALAARGGLESDWIHCTDADALLPTDYFTRVRAADPDAAALVYSFRHVGADGSAPDRAAREYEIWLRYYVAGLAFAGSPYAFHTIGSTLAARADAYARVRGFPRRLAAEDFYLLNKLAKLGAVQTLAGDPIELSSRASARVPFGTGRAMIDAQQGLARTLYHPGVFDALQTWQRALAEMAKRPRCDDRTALQAIAPKSTVARLEDALDSIGALGRKPVSAADPKVRLRQLHQRFDAARTLKLIHALRDGGMGNMPIAEAISAAEFVDWQGREADLGAISLALGGL